MDLDFLNTNRPVTVTNTATPTPKTPVFIVGDTSAPVPPSSIATAARIDARIVVDTRPSVPSSPFATAAKRALSVSPQQPGGNKVAKVVLQSPDWPRLRCSPPLQSPPSGKPP